MAVPVHQKAILFALDCAENFFNKTLKITILLLTASLILEKNLVRSQWLDFCTLNSLLDCLDNFLNSEQVAWIHNQISLTII